MQGDTVHHRGHPELTHAIVDVITVVASAFTFLQPDQMVRFEPAVGGAAHEFRQQRAISVEGVLRRFAAGDGFGLFVNLGDECLTSPPNRGEVRRYAALEFSRQFGVFATIVFKPVVPVGLCLRADFLGVPSLIDFGRDFEGGIRPAYSSRTNATSSAPNAAPAFFLALLVW